MFEFREAALRTHCRSRTSFDQHPQKPDVSVTNSASVSGTLVDSSMAAGVVTSTQKDAWRAHRRSVTLDQFSQYGVAAPAHAKVAIIVQSRDGNSVHVGNANARVLGL